MIKRILTYYAARLDEYLSRTHRQPEGLAAVYEECWYEGTNVKL